jgi:hypothetical protein
VHGRYDLDDLAERIMAFQDRYNATAAPFDRTYTRDDLNAFLRSMANHDDSLAMRQAA